MPTHKAFGIPIIAFEGIDGAGKTTIISMLQNHFGAELNIYFTGEFQSPVGDTLLSTNEWRLDPILKLYAFAADRAFIFNKISNLAVPPKLIVWDRYTDSALAYREAEKRLGKSFVGACEAELINSLFPKPRHIFFFDVPVDTAIRRKEGDKDTLQKVREIYTKCCHNVSATIIDASQPLKIVFKSAKNELLKIYHGITDSHT